MSQVVLTSNDKGHNSAEIRVGRWQFVLAVIVILVWTITVYTAGMAKAAQYAGQCKSTPFRMERRGKDVIVCVIVEERGNLEDY